MVNHDKQRTVESFPSSVGMAKWKWKSAAKARLKCWHVCTVPFHTIPYTITITDDGGLVQKGKDAD